VSERGTFAILAVAAFIVGLQTAIINPNLSLYATEQVGMSPQALAVFYGLFHTSALLSTVGIPFLTDKYGGRKTAFVCAVIGTAIGIAILSGVSAFWMALIVSVLLLGPASSSIGLFFAYLRRTENGPKRVVQMRAVFSLAWVLGPACAGLSISAYGIPALFAGTGFLGLFILAIYRWLPDERDVRSRHGDESRRSAGLEESWQKLLVILILLQATNAIMMMATPLIVVNHLSQPLHRVSFLFALCAVFEIPLFILVGRMFGTYSCRGLMLAGSLAGMAYYVGMFLSSSFALLLALQVLNALFIACLMGVGMAWFQQVMPNHVGLATGMYLNTSRVGALLGAPLAAGLVDITGGDFRIAALLSAALTALGIGLLWHEMAAARRDREQHPTP